MLILGRQPEGFTTTHLLSLVEQMYCITQRAPCQYLNYSAAAAAFVPSLFGLQRTPGPMVDATAQDFTY